MGDSDFETIWGEELSEQVIAECLEIETQASQAVPIPAGGGDVFQSSTRSRFPPLPRASSLSRMQENLICNSTPANHGDHDTSQDNLEQSKFKSWKSLPIPSSSLATTEWLRSQLEKLSESNKALLSEKQTLEGEVHLLRQRSKTEQSNAAKRVELENQMAAAEKEKFRQKIAELERDLQSTKVQLAFKTKQAESDFGKYDNYRKLAVLEPEISFSNPSLVSHKRTKTQSEKRAHCSNQRDSSDDEDEDYMSSLGFKAKKSKLNKNSSFHPSVVHPTKQSYSAYQPPPLVGDQEEASKLESKRVTEENKSTELPSSKNITVQDGSSSLDLIFKSWHWNPDAVSSDIPDSRNSDSLLAEICRPPEKCLKEKPDTGKLLSNILGDTFFTPAQSRLKVSLSSKFEYSKQNVLKIDKMDTKLLNELSESGSVWGINAEMTGCGMGKGSVDELGSDKEERCLLEFFPHSRHSTLLSNLDPIFTHVRALINQPAWHQSTDFLKSIILHLTQMVNESFELICDPLIPNRIKNKFYYNEEKIGLLFLKSEFGKNDLLSPRELCPEEKHVALRQSITLLSYLCAMDSNIAEMLINPGLMKNDTFQCIEQRFPVKADNIPDDEDISDQHPTSLKQSCSNASYIRAEPARTKYLKNNSDICRTSKSNPIYFHGIKRNDTVNLIKTALRKFGEMDSRTGGDLRPSSWLAPTGQVAPLPTTIIPLHRKNVSTLMSSLTSFDEEFSAKGLEEAGQWLNIEYEEVFPAVPVRPSRLDERKHFKSWYEKYHADKVADPTTTREPVGTFQKGLHSNSNEGGENSCQDMTKGRNVSKPNYSDLSHAPLLESERSQLNLWFQRSTKYLQIQQDLPRSYAPNPSSDGESFTSDVQNSFFLNTDISSECAQPSSFTASCWKEDSELKSFPQGPRAKEPLEETTKKINPEGSALCLQKLGKELNPAGNKFSNDLLGKKRSLAPLKKPLKKEDIVESAIFSENLQMEIEKIYENNPPQCGLGENSSHKFMPGELDLDHPEFLEHFSNMYKRVLKSSSRLNRKMRPFSKLALAKRNPDPLEQMSGAPSEIIIKDFSRFGANKTPGQAMSSQQERNCKAIVDLFIREAKDYDLSTLIKAFKKQVGNLTLVEGLKEILHSVNFCRLTSSYYPFLLSCVNLIESILIHAVKKDDIKEETLFLLCDVLNEVSCCQPPPYILERILDVLLMASTFPNIVNCLCNKRNTMMSLISKQEFCFFKGVCLMQPLCYLVSMSLESQYQEVWRLGLRLTRWLCHLYRLHALLLRSWYLDSYDQASRICNCIPLQHTCIFTTVSKAAAYYKNHVDDLTSDSDTRWFLEEIMKNGIKLCDLLVRIDPLFVINLKDFELYNEFLSNIEVIHEDSVLFPNIKFSHSEIFVVKKLMVAAEMALEVKGASKSALPLFSSLKTISSEDLADISDISLSCCDKLYQHC